jgi:beta-1,2-mannosidase
MKRLFLILFLVLSCISLHSQDWVLGPFVKTRENPIISADSSMKFLDPLTGKTIAWQKADVFNPGAVVKNDKVYLFIRCEDNPKSALGGRTSRIGLCYSEDGIHFQKHPEPVLYPEDDSFSQYDHPGGCEDPRIVETEEGTYVMTYTSWNYKTARLSVAVSEDLFHWQKKGPAFAKAFDGRFLDNWSKSGSIITEMKKGRLVAAKIKGRYWMYWGEQFVNLAWSDNLSDWYPTVDENGKLRQLIGPRPGKFDSSLTECGPPALITDKGILLLYNGRNANNGTADPDLPKGTYSVGQALFSTDDPEKVIARTDTCILKPTLPHEITGQYSSGTTFSEGLVCFMGKWFLYYGTADSFVGLAVKE